MILNWALLPLDLLLDVADILARLGARMRAWGVRAVHWQGLEREQ